MRRYVRMGGCRAQPPTAAQMLPDARKERADRTAQGFTVDSKPAKHEVLIRRPIVLYGAAFLLRDAGACRDGAVVMGIHGHERSHIYF